MRWKRALALSTTLILAVALSSCASSTEDGSPPSEAVGVSEELPTKLIKSFPVDARDIAFTPDGSAGYAAMSRSVGGGDREVGVLVQYDPQALTQVDSFDVGSDAEQVLISPDGHFAYVASSNTTDGGDGIWVIDLDTKATVGTIDTGKSSSVRNMVLNADGTTLYATDWLSKNRVFVIDTKSNRVEKTIDVDMEPEGLALAPDESKLALAADDDERLGPGKDDPVVAILDPDSGKVQDRVQVPTGASVVEWIGDAIIVAGSTKNSSSVASISADTLTITSTVDLAGHPFDAAVYPNQDDVYFAISADDENSTPIYSVGQQRIVTAAAAGGEAYAIAVRPDGEQVWIANWAGDSLEVLGR